MGYWMDFGAWKERHRELVREAERGRLAREVREVRGVHYAGGWLRDFIAVAGTSFISFSRAFRG